MFYSGILQKLEANPAAAYQRMWELYENAVTNYTADSIRQLFISNLTANKRKYDELIEFYEENFYPFSDYYRNEKYEHIRTPDLESSSSSSATGTATTERNQTRTETKTPDEYTTERTHKVDPFDETGLRNESQDITVESGSSSITESYDGDPDLTQTTNSAISTILTTGTDHNKYDKIIHGRNGQRPTSEVVEDGLLAAAMHDILDIIIGDIADQIFLQVWI